MKLFIKIVFSCVFCFSIFDSSLAANIDYSKYPQKASICDLQNPKRSGLGAGAVCLNLCDCGKDLTCTEGYCTPYIRQREVENKRGPHWYRIAHGGPYQNDYILNVEYTCIDDVVFIWVDEKEYKITSYNAKNKPDVQPKIFSITLKKGERFRIQLYDIHNKLKGKADNADFKGRVYLKKIVTQEK